MAWYEIFPRILNMSLTASVIICVVLLCRLLLKGAPKKYSYVLWSVVLFRLLCPVSFSAPVSVLGIFNTPVIERTSENADDKTSITSTVAYIPADIVHMEYPEITVPAPVIGEAVSDTINEILPQGEEQLRADPLEAPITIAAWLWMLGILGMIVGGTVSYIRLRYSLVGALKLRANIYVADSISSPFVLGIVRPKIYLPSTLDEKEHGYIILHEKYHIRRGDHLFKLMAYAALCIHWFNPLVWLAFKLYVKDMEMSCDEAVIRKLGENIRADYSASLLQLATDRQILSGAPLAFGEAEPSGRIKNLSRWKRPTVIASILAAVVCVIAVVVCSLNPAVSHDTLRMTKQENPVIGNEVVYEVELGKQVQEANVYAEAWENGKCKYLACLPIDERAKELHIQMKERRAEGTMTGVDIRLNSDVPGGTQVAYAEFSQENTFLGYAFDAYEEGDTVIALPGEEKILAAMVFDTGEGVRVFDPDTLLNEPERLKQAEYMLVIRAVFDEGSRRDVPKEEFLNLSENMPEEILGMSYLDFRKLTGVDAEFYHADFYAAELPASDVTAIFLAEGWDENNAMAVLQEDDQVIRLEGKMSDLFDDCTEDMSLEEFVNHSMWCNRLIDYKIEQGAGTAYYVAERYVTLKYDMNGDSRADRMLQIELNQSECIAPDANCWLLSVSYENEMMNSDETVVYNGKEYKKSELCNATLHWLELSEHERIASSYLPPEFMVFEESWGITLTTENVTPTGAIIKCTQSGGEPTGELQTGSWYVLENWTQENGWKEVERVLQGELAWTMEAWGIQKNSTSEWEVDWKLLYGELLPGKYRIGKSIMDFRAPGDYDEAIYFAEFILGAGETSNAENSCLYDRLSILYNIAVS